MNLYTFNNINHTSKCHKSFLDLQYCIIKSLIKIIIFILSACLPTQLPDYFRNTSYIASQSQDDREMHIIFFTITLHLLCRYVSSLDDLISEQCLCYVFPLNNLSFQAFHVATCNIRIVQPVIFTGSYLCNFITTQLSRVFLQVKPTIAFMFINFNSLGLHLTLFFVSSLSYVCKKQTSQEIRYMLAEEHAHVLHKNKCETTKLLEFKT